MESENKENVNPIQLMDDMKNISVDSLLETGDIPQVVDSTGDKEADNQPVTPLVDRSIGPALTLGSTSSLEQSTLDQPIGDILGQVQPGALDPPMHATMANESSNQKMFAQDGDMAGNNSSAIDHSFMSQSPMIREAEVYADDLARELINDTNLLVRSEHSAEDAAATNSGGFERKEEEKQDNGGFKEGGNTEDPYGDGNNGKGEIGGKIVEEDEEKVVDPHNSHIEPSPSAALTMETQRGTHIVEKQTEQKDIENLEQEEVVERQGQSTAPQPISSSSSSSSLDANGDKTDNAIKFDPDDNLDTTKPATVTFSNIHDAHQSFQTAAGTSLLVDCDHNNKLADMEFTKNYSDDLLMGQNDGAQQGEIPTAGVDLADFELPPYSGSSSGSEPRQHSPVKRKSSSSSSGAQQPSSSQQMNAATPSLTAVKSLLMSSYLRVSHVLYWKKPIETGVIFTVGVTLITALTFFSIISVIAYTALGIISASGLIRIYKAVMKALNRPSETPFDHMWDKVRAVNVSMSPEKMHELVDASLGNLNASLVYFKQVLLVEDKFATFKFGLFLYSLTYLGAWFNGMTLITITYLLLFSVPFFYEKNRTKIDEYLDLATGQVSMVASKVTSLACGSPASSTSTKKQN